MPIPRIENPGPKLNRATIAALERELGVQFPEQYQQFLMQTNGGSPEPPYFRMGEGGSELNCFYQVGASRAIFDLAAVVKSLRQRVPHALIPIGDDAGGNLVCIGITGKRRGQIFFWDHEEEREKPTYANIGKIANSFNEFLEGFHDLD